MKLENFLTFSILLSSTSRIVICESSVCVLRPLEVDRTIKMEKYIIKFFWSSILKETPLTKTYIIVLIQLRQLGLTNQIAKSDSSNEKARG